MPFDKRIATLPRTCAAGASERPVLFCDLYIFFATRYGKDSNKIRYSISNVDLYTICMKKLNFLHTRHLPSAELDDDLFVAVAHVLKCVTPLTVESHRVETIFISSLQN